jgi:hypothetical protein
VQTNGTIHNHKPDIIIHDNERGTCMSIDVANSRERNPIRKDVDSILKCKDMTIETQRMWHIKTSVTNSDRGNWNYLKIIKKIPEQSTGKA